MQTKGFTLIEMFVVLGIIATIVGVILGINYLVSSNDKQAVNSIATPAYAEEKLPNGITTFMDGPVVCYIMERQSGGLATASWNYYGGISCVKY